MDQQYQAVCPVNINNILDDILNAKVFIMLSVQSAHTYFSYVQPFCYKM